MATASDIAKAIDSREAFVLRWITRKGTARFEEVSGLSLDNLIGAGLVELTDEPQQIVRCTDLGLEVASEFGGRKWLKLRAS